MGFRQLLRQAVKPAAMVGVVGMLSLSLIVTTPSTAQALETKYEKLTPAATFVMGATKTVAPVALAAASFHPVGMALRLGLLAYATSDIWMPIMSEAFGQGGSNENTPAPSGIGVLPGLTFSSVYAGIGGVGTNQVIVKGSYAYPVPEMTGVTYAASLNCRNTSSGVTTVRQWITNQTLEPTSTAPTDRYSNGMQCRTTLTGGSVVSGEVIDGGVFGAPGADPALPSVGTNPGPENVFRFGNGAGTAAGFDPRGPDVGYQGKSECIDSAGTVSWVSGPVTPGDNDGAMLMPSCEKAGKGHGTGRVQVEGFKPDGTTETVWDTGANPLTDPATPLCDPGRATSGCVLEVTKDGQPCATGDVECENWASESKKEGNTRYGCKLGSYVMPLSACSLLEKAYFPGGAPLNDENTDGNPSTSSPLGPNGQPAPVPAPVTTGTGVSPVPGGAGAPAAGADSSAASCWPRGWGMFNPFEWVYRPTVCAMRAMFEPSKSIQTRVNTMATGFSNKVPMSWFGVGVEGVAGGACPTNWAVELNGHSYSLICGSQADEIIRGFRPYLGGMLIMAMLWPLIRALFYAAIPVFKVTPS